VPSAVKCLSPRTLEMAMTTKVWINGTYHDKLDAKVSVYDHGLLYGDGVFEGLRIYSKTVFKLKEHIDRLYESAQAIALTIPLTREAMIAAVNDAVAVNQKVDGYIRPNVIIIVDDISLYPRELYDGGMAVITSSYIRNHPNALNPRIKSLNYLNNILAKIEAIRAGCLEAIMLNHKGEVAECTGDNIFVIKKGVLRTPPSDAGILEGITRNFVIALAKQAGIPFAETTLTRHDVYVADEVFLTGSAAEVIAVTKVDDRLIGEGKQGPITRRLRELFTAAVRA
jgi:branched-chain amino acid aminotransferase